MAIGLYSLFIDSDIPVPKWLRTEDVDSLKSRLAGIIVVMLGVLFLEQVITAAADFDLLQMGIRHRPGDRRLDLFHQGALSLPGAAQGSNGTAGSILCRETLLMPLWRTAQLLVNFQRAGRFATWPSRGWSAAPPRSFGTAVPGFSKTLILPGSGSGWHLA